MAIKIRLPNGRYIKVETDDPKNAQQKAQSYYEQIYNLSTIPDRVTVLNNFANALAENKQNKRAQSIIDVAIALSKGADSYTLSTKGWLFLLEDKNAQALEALRRAHALDSTRPTINYRIALALSNLKRYSEAFEYLDVALKSQTPFDDRIAAQELAKELNYVP